MTYCVGIKLDAGLVFHVRLADQRRPRRDQHLPEDDGLRGGRATASWCMLSAGNLSISQSVREILQVEAIDGPGGQRITIWNATSLFDAARVLGSAVRRVYEQDGESLASAGIDFNASMILGGQVAGEAMRLFLVYSAGNFIEATRETCYFQVGESKYGKPVLDRMITPATPLDEAAKCALVSMDSTLKSNLSVGLPLDLLVYEVDRLQTDQIVCIDEDNPYFQKIRGSWGLKLREAFESLEDRSGATRRRGCLCAPVRPATRRCGRSRTRRRRSSDARSRGAADRLLARERLSAGTYRQIFERWRDAGWEVAAVERIGHDPRFPVSNDWPSCAPS